MVSVQTASIRSSTEAMDQSLSGGAGKPLRITLVVISSLRESDMRELYHRWRTIRVASLHKQVTMPFELQPILKSETLELRPLRADDFESLYAVASDPLIWEQHPNSDRYQPDVFRKFFADALESGGALIAIDRQSDRVIGSSRFHLYDLTRSEVEIGWTFLARSHWGGVYNGEMKRLMLTHAFQFVDNVIFMVGATNVRSQRAVEKIGGVRVGTKLDPEGRESVIFRITKAAYSRQ